ncbi:MAG TPA: poly-gamma-glutamate hydrolase family protein [Thermoanaerobaculia bacterium]
MKHRSTLTALALLGALILSAPVAGQTCSPIGGVDWAQVTLITQPFPFANLFPTPTPEQIQGVPLPNPTTNDIVRREHVYISSSLANMIGIAPYDRNSSVGLNWDWRRPNPQIRVWVEHIDGDLVNDADDTFLNRGKNRSSSAVFTIVGVVQDINPRIWIYRQSTVGNSDRDNGQYKLFAIDTFNGEGKVKTFADSNNDGRLDDVFVRVFRTPVSSSSVTENGVPAPDTHYCEPDGFNGRFQEAAVKTADRRVALLIPHGKDIETKTSDQVAPFVNRLQDNLFNGIDLDLQVNTWDVQGVWGDDQTSKRWHATATNLHESSFPALREMLDREPFAAGRPFQYAVALHGFSATGRRLIIGGQASREERCLVASRIQEEIATVDSAVTVTYEIPAGGTGGLDGDSPNNIVNRLAGPGGIQIEQSKGIRDYSSNLLVAPIARGVAQAVGELIAGEVLPPGICDGF